MASSNSTSGNSDIRRTSAASSSGQFDFATNNHREIDMNVDGASNLEANSMKVNGILRRQGEVAGEITPRNGGEAASGAKVVEVRKKTVDEVWREIIEGKREQSRRRVECKAEAMDEMMTLEDFLVKAGAVDAASVESDGVQVKVEPGTETLSGGILAFNTAMVVSPMQSGGGSGVYVAPGLGTAQSVDSVGGFWNGMEGIGGGGKRRATSLLEPLDKVTQQRQRRMIKNRESAARSRERKQAYQVELESMAERLEQENERLLKEKAQRSKERFKQLMEKVIPVLEKRRPARVLGRVRSM